MSILVCSHPWTTFQACLIFNTIANLTLITPDNTTTITDYGTLSTHRCMHWLIRIFRRTIILLHPWTRYSVWMFHYPALLKSHIIESLDRITQDWNYFNALCCGRERQGVEYRQLVCCRCVNSPWWDKYHPQPFPSTNRWRNITRHACWKPTSSNNVLGRTGH